MNLQVDTAKMLEQKKCNPLRNFNKHNKGFPTNNLPSTPFMGNPQRNFYSTHMEL